MNFMNLNSESTNAKEFISCWSKLYGTGKYSEDDYETNLHLNGLLEKDNVKLLFEWKNNNQLSAKKDIIVNKINDRISKLNDFRRLPKTTQSEFDDFWSFVSSIIGSGIVYKVFVFHISRPDDYPMVDQHVLRGWHFLKTGKIEELKKSPELYLEYRTFVLDMAKQTNRSLREIDKALMAFGQFLISQFSSIVST